MNWDLIYSSLNDKGYAVLPGALRDDECVDFQANYANEEAYRSVINMEHYRFGKGEYKYFRYPLPAVVQSLRARLYEPLAVIANAWMKQLEMPVSFPVTHEQFIESCHARGQLRPTPLILRYEKGGFNTLHQDLYGEVFFPFQVVFLLTEEGRDHEGGEFVLTEQIPRAQSRAEVVRLRKGDGMIFTTNFRPVKGSKGYYRVSMKHGVSEVRSGVRYALGIIFHDAT